MENRRDRDPAYGMTETLLRTALSRASAGRVTPLWVKVACDDARDAAAWAQADILVAGRLDTAAVAQMKNLKMIQCTSAGVEGYLPLDWMPPGVELFNASGAHAAKVSAFGAMAVMMLHERVPARIAAQNRRRWDRTLRPAPRGQHVLIYGAGALGGAVAEALASLGFHVTGVARRPTGPRPGFAEIAGPDDLMRLLPTADILVVSAPLTDETRGRFGLAELRSLPPGAGVLNIARAGLMDYTALADLLEEGHLSGAILDVFETEPLPPDARWWTVPNLMVFPHVSADDPTSYASACASILADNLAAMLRGAPLRNHVDPRLGY
ncbi:D-isomer specific 2-hydroxyacid dehydrogenase [Celeribacter indicus]|uniref:D-isomer specific 2-hydroxyacid dehydrogenase n=1 Tax=Celeribacter indicus TaxID=1208324 RepID=A0A0B5DVX0_9RHOB|nr:D-isomer specific 2-hydroxyacid dehydrogenase [Celeribacter indicus]